MFGSRIILTKNNLKFGYIFFAILIIPMSLFYSDNFAQAKYSVFFDNLNIIDNHIFIGRYPDRMIIFDILDKRVVGGVENFDFEETKDLLNIYDRLLVYNNTLYLTDKNKIKKIGRLPGLVTEFDKDNFYIVKFPRYCNRPEEYAPYRIGMSEAAKYLDGCQSGKCKPYSEIVKIFPNLKEGHFDEYPELTIIEKTEDKLTYWFLCSFSKDIIDTNKRGFALVSKNKLTGKIEIFKSAEAPIWENGAITNDRDSVWLLLIQSHRLGDDHLINFNKKFKRLSITNYVGGKAMVKNLDVSNLPSWTYVVHQSNRFYKMSSNDVLQGRGVKSDTLLALKGYRQRIWEPNLEYVNPGTVNPQIKFKGEIDNDFFIAIACTYGEDVWLVAKHINQDDGTVCHIIKVPFNGGDIEYFPVQPTLSEKSRELGHKIYQIFELIPMLLIGGH